jgi:hypothetical protein
METRSRSALYKKEKQPWDRQLIEVSGLLKKTLNPKKVSNLQSSAVS